MGFDLLQMDFKSASLNKDIHGEVYVKQPPGFEDVDSPYHVLKLNKALYDLKKKPRACYESLSKSLFRMDSRGSR